MLRRAVALALLGIAGPAVAARAQAPQMAAVLRGVPLSLEACRARLADALKAEGYTGLLSFGSGWIAQARRTSVTAGCLAGERETLLLLVTAGGQAIVAEAKRLFARMGDTTARTVLPAEAASRAEVAWNTTADSLDRHPGTRYSFWCPPNGVIKPVWGTELYASNSSVCSAAVHAGTLTPQSGGNAIIEIRPGQASYDASSRYGVTTQARGAWQASFVIVGAR